MWIVLDLDLIQQGMICFMEEVEIFFKLHVFVHTLPEIVPLFYCDSYDHMTDMILWHLLGFKNQFYL